MFITLHILNICYTTLQLPKKVSVDLKLMFSVISFISEQQSINFPCHFLDIQNYQIQILLQEK